MLVFQDVRLRRGEFQLELDVATRGQVTAVFGPSGAGKTTLLDLVAGLCRADSARIEVGGRLLTDTRQNVTVPACRRELGYVPQDLALFPHLSVRQNLLYGARKVGGPQASFEQVTELLEIAPLKSRSIAELSGGEKQRVALGRALLSSPRLLLLDEPLGSLDAPLKARVLPYLIRIRDELRIPMLYVTHDRYEALAIADEMIVLDAGRIAQSGPIEEIFSRPASTNVAGILAIETIQPGRVVSVEDGLATVLVGSASLVAWARDLPPGATAVHVCIRAEDVILVEGAAVAGSPRNRLPAIVRAIQGRGALVRVELDCGFPLTAVLTEQALGELALAPGVRTVAWIKAPSVHLVSGVA